MKAVLALLLAGVLLFVSPVGARFNSQAPLVMKQIVGIDDLGHAREYAEEGGAYIGRDEVIDVDMAQRISSTAFQGGYRCISLYRCEMMTDCLSSVLANALSSSSETEWLSLHHCGIEEVALSRMSVYKDPRCKKVANNKKLRLLDLSFNQFSSNSQKSGSNSISSISNSILEMTGSAYASGLEFSSSSTTKTVNMQDSNVDTSSRCYKAIAGIVSGSPALEYLVLDGNKIESENVRTIVHSVRRHPSLHTLSLSMCGLGDESVEFLTFCLKSNSQLQHLDLSQNDFSETGLRLLLNALQEGTLRNLKSLDLSYLALGDDFMRELAKGILNNRLPNLKSLHLRGVDVGQDSLLVLLKALSMRIRDKGAPMRLLALDISGNPLVPYPVQKDKSRGLSSKLRTYHQMMSATVNSMTPKVQDSLSSVLSQGLKAANGFSTMLESGTEMGLKYISGEGDEPGGRYGKISGVIDTVNGNNIAYGKSSSGGRYNSINSNNSKRNKRNGNGGGGGGGTKGKGKNRGRGSVNRSRGGKKNSKNSNKLQKFTAEFDDLQVTGVLVVETSGSDGGNEDDRDRDAPPRHRYKQSKSKPKGDPSKGTKGDETSTPNSKAKVKLKSKKMKTKILKKNKVAEALKELLVASAAAAAAQPVSESKSESKSESEGCVYHGIQHLGLARSGLDAKTCKAIIKCVDHQLPSQPLQPANTNPAQGQASGVDSSDSSLKEGESVASAVLLEEVEEAVEQRKEDTSMLNVLLEVNGLSMTDMGNVVHALRKLGAQ